MISYNICRVCSSSLNQREKSSSILEGLNGLNRQPSKLQIDINGQKFQGISNLLY